jgi:TonB C terminal
VGCPNGSRQRPERLASYVAGGAGTVLVHALLVFPLILDLSPPSRSAAQPGGPGASVSMANQDATMTVVFINETSETPAPVPALKPEELASRGSASADLPVVVLSADPMPAGLGQDPKTSEKSLSTSSQPEDKAQYALLYGRYATQIQARIERAWMRPRNPLDAPRFSCRARIEQDRRGDVAAIHLDACNGSERWRESLVSAIRMASPLPAPPDPSVYADRLVLTFESEAFRADGPTEGFEPVRVITFPMRGRDQSNESFEGFASGRDALAGQGRSDDSGVVHLTIIGTPQDTPALVTPPADAAPPNLP